MRNANAEHIVRCVNAHGDLLAAMREIEQIPYSLNDVERCKIARLARAAIAKATAKEPC